MKIDFYVLDTQSGQQSLFFACQLIEKIHTEQHRRIYVNMNSREEAERFDALLWTYRDDSFLPHDIYRQDNPNPPPIQIGHHEAPDGSREVLLNLSRDFPLFHENFEHVIEIVFSDPLVQQLARERYKQYRDKGYDINTIKLKANEP
jgi:DNA polymerase-3 subunit chi